MANDLTALPQFTRNLFRHAYIFLPWFCRNFEAYHFNVDDYNDVIEYLAALKQDRPEFFGSRQPIEKARKKLEKFYDALVPTAEPAQNQQALAYFSRAWHHAWNNREHFELRAHEVRLMKFFHEIFCKSRSEHLPELQCMARLIDTQTVKLARCIRLPGGVTPAKALKHANAEVREYERQFFGSEEPSPRLCHKLQKRRPGKYTMFQKALRRRKEAARLRITEIFDTQGWFFVIDSSTLHQFLKREGLEDFLPTAYRGRIGVQPTGYPLTFYTYAGLELETPPLNEVTMNMDYGMAEPDKDYKIHPVSDGTFYCETTAVVGDSRTKHYTLEYKRRARRLKYDSVNNLAEVIDDIRGRMVLHLQSENRDTWVRALMCLLIDSECARIGNHESAKGEKKTYGITTLQTAKHVKVTKDRIVITYAGKHEQRQQHALPRYRTLKGRAAPGHEAIVADRLLQLVNEKRKFLFTRQDGRPYTPQMVNDYFTASPEPDLSDSLPEGGVGSPCTVHNMRNYHATRIFRKYAAGFAAENPDPSYQQVLIAYQGRNQTKKYSAVEGVLQIIAGKLGNTPAICRKSYIDPKEQLLFFQRWGYRPPDCITRDLFVSEEDDTYGMRQLLRYERRKANQPTIQSPSQRKKAKAQTHKNTQRRNAPNAPSPTREHMRPETDAF